MQMWVPKGPGHPGDARTTARLRPGATDFDGGSHRPEFARGQSSHALPGWELLSGDGPAGVENDRSPLRARRVLGTVVTRTRSFPAMTCRAR